MKRRTVTERMLQANRENAKKAGRKPGVLGEEAKKKIEIRKQLVERVGREIKPLLDAMMTAAKGHLYEVRDENGTLVRIAKRSPSVEMLKYLADQTAGKAPQTIDINANVKRTLTLDEIEAGARGDVFILNVDE